MANERTNTLIERLNRLKDSLDTIRETASELMEEVEKQLQELQPDKKIVFSSDLSRYEFSAMQRAETLINDLEAECTVFTADERNLIMNYAYKLNDMDKTEELTRRLYKQKLNDSQETIHTIATAQAEIKALPDPMIGLWEMKDYGYAGNEMLPLTQERALELFDRELPVYLLYRDNSEAVAEDREQISTHEGIFGIERVDWEKERAFLTLQKELSENREHLEPQLLYGSTDQYGIYQLKDNPELKGFHFTGTGACGFKNQSKGA